jgi:hypothetical protein
MNVEVQAVGRFQRLRSRGYSSPTTTAHVTGVVGSCCRTAKFFGKSTILFGLMTNRHSGHVLPPESGGSAPNSFGRGNGRSEARGDIDVSVQTQQETSGAILYLSTFQHECL